MPYDFPMRMRGLVLLVCVLMMGLRSAGAVDVVDTNSPVQLLTASIKRLVSLLDPQTNQPAQVFTTTLKLVRAEGLPELLTGRELKIALQSPGLLKLDAGDFLLGRNHQELWLFSSRKHFGVLGKTNVPPFSGSPIREEKPLGPLELPFPAEQLLVLPVLSDIEMLPGEPVNAEPCRVLKAMPKPEAASLFRLPQLTLQVWIRESDFMPLRIDYRQTGGMSFRIELIRPQLSPAFPADFWQLTPRSDDTVQTVAHSHLTRFVDVALRSQFNSKPGSDAPRENRMVATEGAGRLEWRNGARILFLRGSPEEMGRQHGALLRTQTMALVERVLYGVGVGSSFEKGSWFFDEMEAALQRLSPHIDRRYFQEMDALSAAAGLDAREVRLANLFPELFHCSWFAVWGKATQSGRLYHGRVLDYLRGVGLEPNATVIVMRPAYGNAWVNLGYAGFVGSVTAMNEKGISLGEMGGRGEGNWDGKPMSLLVREVMEKANTLEQALEIMRRGPRTCEYYYVISDGKAKKAVAIGASPTRFDTVWAGQTHPQLPHAIDDAVVLSAGDRYEELVRRVRSGYGKLDSTSAWNLMKRPVSMTSNIQCALFDPESLDFWVANANPRSVAADAGIIHLNLGELLKE